MSIMYKVCKRIIERGNYPENMMLRINAFFNANLITKDEYSELIQLIQ